MIRKIVNDWDKPGHVGEGHSFFFVNEIPEQESRPSTARAEVADEENIIWKHRQPASRGCPPKCGFGSDLQSCKYPVHLVFSDRRISMLLPGTSQPTPSI